MERSEQQEVKKPVIKLKLKTQPSLAAAPSLPAAPSQSVEGSGAIGASGLKPKTSFKVLCPAHVRALPRETAAARRRPPERKARPAGRWAPPRLAPLLRS